MSPRPSLQYIKQQFYCVAVQRPELTLEKIIQFIPQRQKENQHTNTTMRLYKRYFLKACIVLRQIAKAIHHLHLIGIVHGDIRTQTCGKFGPYWKIMNILGSKVIGDSFTQSRMSSASPPESVDFDSKSLSSDVGCFKRYLQANVSIDVWSFGKLMYEVIVGEPLIPFSNNTKIKPRNDHHAISILGTWDDDSLHFVQSQLCKCFESNSGQDDVNDDDILLISKSCVDLICNCLRSNPLQRIKSMDEVLQHTFWKEVSKKVMVFKKKKSVRRVEI